MEAIINEWIDVQNDIEVIGSAISSTEQQIQEIIVLVVYRVV